MANFIVKNQESSKTKIMKDLEDFQKEMEGSTYKMVDNERKLNIQCSVFSGKKAKYGLISISDITNVQKFEK